MPTRRSTWEQLRQTFYLTQRTMGDASALRRGRLPQRLVRRAATRRIMRTLWGK